MISEDEFESKCRAIGGKVLGFNICTIKNKLELELERNQLNVALIDKDLVFSVENPKIQVERRDAGDILVISNKDETVNVEVHTWRKRPHVLVSFK